MRGFHPYNFFSLQLQLRVLSVRGVETSPRGGGVGGLSQQPAAVQPGRIIQQGRPQRVSQIPAFSSPSSKRPRGHKCHVGPLKPALLSHAKTLHLQEKAGGTKQQSYMWDSTNFDLGKWNSSTFIWI